jgi:hypothetical protein
MSSPIPRDIPELPAIPDMAVVMPSYVPPTAVTPPVRRRAVAVFRLLTALTAAAGIALALLSAVRAGGGAHPLPPSPPQSPAQSLPKALLPPLTHFTVQANLVLATVTAISAARSWRAARPLTPTLVTAALLYVLTASLVHHAFASTAHLPPRSDQLLHTATPVLATIDWLLLTAPAGFTLRRATAPLLYPLAYLTATLALTLTLTGSTDGGRPVPYPFLDVHAHGYLTATGNALLVALSCYALSTLLAALDAVRPDLTRLPPKTGFRLRPPVG